MKQALFIACMAICLFSACKQATDSSKDSTTLETKDSATPTEEVTNCYLLMHGKDINALQLTINPDNTVKGYIAYEPFETDGGRGFFEGKKVGNFISGSTTYMIEGSTQTDKAIFKMVENGISKGVGQYDPAKDNMDYSNIDSVKFKDVYKSIDCSQIVSSINRAKEVSKIIKTERSKRYGSLTGTYQYDLGNNLGSGVLKVKQLEGNQVKISFEIVMHGPSSNQGSGEGIINLNENLEGIFTPKDSENACQILFSFSDNKVISKQIEGDFMDCGFGNNVSANQEFSKTETKDPF